MSTPFLLIDQLGSRAGFTPVDGINPLPVGLRVGSVVVNATNPLPVNRTSEYPTAAIVVTSSSGNVAALDAVATLPATAGLTNFITGFEVTSAGSTAGAVVNVTVTGVVGGTMTFTYVTVAGAVLGNIPLIVQFPMPIQAAAVNTAIVVTLPSLGLGNTNAAVVAHGYRQ